MTPHSPATFRVPSLPLYFHHVVDEASGTLQVQILGADIQHTFHHRPERLPRRPGALVKKSSGFLAAVKPSSSSSGNERVVLSWAESGHGMGPLGPSLRPGPRLVTDKKWTAAAIRLAAVMGVSLKSPFDRPDGAGAAGRFKGSHVEVKLATHAVAVLLRLAAGQGPASADADADDVVFTTERLAGLRGVRWKGASPGGGDDGGGGEAPRFEIYVSRRNCATCGLFVRRLRDLTGVQLVLRPRQRLAPVEYAQQALRPMRTGGGGGVPAPLRTLVRDGVVHYIPPEQTADEDAAGTEEGPARSGRRGGGGGRTGASTDKSPVVKPLPATAVFEAPSYMGGGGGCGDGSGSGAATVCDGVLMERTVIAIHVEML